MKSIKKLLCLMLCLHLALGAVGCGGAKKESGKLKIVCTVFPIYDWVKEIAGDRCEVTRLLKNNTDMHSFQPSAKDIVAIAESDIFVFIGGASDAWVKEALCIHENKERAELPLIDTEGTNTYCSDHSHKGKHHHHADEADEHIWLSLKNTKLYVDSIARVLAEKDSENAEFYLSRAQKYTEKLDLLDKAYTETAQTAKYKTLIFADRFPFIYLVKDYGIHYFAAFEGCSADSEADFETVAFLARKTDEIGVKYLLKTETADSKIADTVISVTKSKKQKLLTLDSIQSVGVKDRTSYIEIMEKNLETLKKAMN